MRTGTTAARLKNVRQRLAAANAERDLASGKPTWNTHPQFVEALREFKFYIGDPVDVLGRDWEAFFLPWEVMIAGYADHDLKREFMQHQKADAEEFDAPSWSFGEMVVRQHKEDTGA
ncbi:hypothetical protein B9P84_22200 [Citrobacter braakii]|uniref:hypothetical protein n=1 Tax=Citrobacter freundii complex TaxID=1344959 RepID=UPI000B9B1F07|nr:MULTISPECIES: hypothetical protein [Citrobacter freundii complex]EKZ3398136.1 hypothetical protein [Citrobacter freundii]EKZ3406585.1 hypothetical protein [Citrobacter freundii]MBJ8674500.1 hypothetical protein [Citrobacter freundii]MDL4385309.1 hypothetical protein [Citrobacter braakii]OXU09672.1 hypothetical protein B9P84_22200 [Citrobacter braakii]